MTIENPCSQCIGQKGSGEECCIDVFIILNPDENHLFEEFFGFYNSKEDDGAVFYTEKGCPYLDDDLHCNIHHIKPLYCKFYPIFITGDPYIDDKCPAHYRDEYVLDKNVKDEIKELQERYPIYKKEWLWEEVKQFIQVDLK